MVIDKGTEAIFLETLDSVEMCVKVNAEYINNIRYADDTTMIAEAYTI